MCSQRARQHDWSRLPLALPARALYLFFGATSTMASAASPVALPWYANFLCAGLGACTAEVRAGAHHTTRAAGARVTATLRDAPAPVDSTLAVPALHVASSRPAAGDAAH